MEKIKVTWNFYKDDIEFGVSKNISDLKIYIYIILIKNI